MLPFFFGIGVLAAVVFVITRPQRARVASQATPSDVGNQWNADISHLSTDMSSVDSDSDCDSGDSGGGGGGGDGGGADGGGGQ